MSMIYDYQGNELDVNVNTTALDYDVNVKGINHRGYNTVAPENTLPAFKLSKRNGFNFVECDVRATSDNVLVLLHDGTINRTARNADGTAISATTNIADITYEQALTYDFGVWKSPIYQGTKIPTLEQFIKLCKDLGLHPYIELESILTQSQVEACYDVVQSCGMKDKATWISFSSAHLTTIKNIDEYARLGFIVSQISSNAVNVVNDLKTTTNYVFIDGPSSSSDELVNLCIDADVPLEVWTANTQSAILGLNSYISGVTSDSLIAGQVLYNANIE